MEQSRLKRHAALAIVMVGVATALVAIGRILAQDSETDAAQSDDQDSWSHFSSRCASDRLKTPPPPESMAMEGDRTESAPPQTPIAADADFRGCGGGDRKTDFWTTNVEGLYTTGAPLVEKPGEERR